MCQGKVKTNPDLSNCDILVDATSLFQETRHRVLSTTLQPPPKGTILGVG